MKELVLDLVTLQKILGATIMEIGICISPEVDARTTEIAEAIASNIITQETVAHYNKEDKLSIELMKYKSHYGALMTVLYKEQQGTDMGSEINDLIDEIISRMDVSQIWRGINHPVGDDYVIPNIGKLVTVILDLRSGTRMDRLMAVMIFDLTILIIGAMLHREKMFMLIMDDNKRTVFTPYSDDKESFVQYTG